MTAFAVEVVAEALVVVVAVVAMEVPVLVLLLLLLMEADAAAAVAVDGEWETNSEPVRRGREGVGVSWPSNLHPMSAASNNHAPNRCKTLLHSEWLGPGSTPACKILALAPRLPAVAEDVDDDDDPLVPTGAPLVDFGPEGALNPELPGMVGERDGMDWERSVMANPYRSGA